MVQTNIVELESPSSDFWFSLRKMILKGFLLSSYVSWTIYTNFCSPFPKKLYMKFYCQWTGSFGEVVVIYVYVETGQGQTAPCGHTFYNNLQ